MFVEKIKERLKDSSKELEKISAAITTSANPPEILTQEVAKAKRSLDDAICLVSHCQKLIKVLSAEFYFHKPITVHLELYLFYRFIHFLLYIGQY